MDALSLRRLDPGADSDLNEFFHKDSIISGKELLSVTYAIEKNSAITGFISVSNDAIKKEDLTRSRARKLFKFIPRGKHYKSMPAVKIGRLAICKDNARKGIGTMLLDYVKFWFTEGNKTGCRFIVVDAYNREETISFYTKNGFDFLISSSILALMRPIRKWGGFIPLSLQSTLFLLQRMPSLFLICPSPSQGV